MAFGRKKKLIILEEKIKSLDVEQLKFYIEQLSTAENRFENKKYSLIH